MTGLPLTSERCTSCFLSSPQPEQRNAIGCWKRNLKKAEKTAAFHRIQHSTETEGTPCPRSDTCQNKGNHQRSHWYCFAKRYSKLMQHPKKHPMWRGKNSQILASFKHGYERKPPFVLLKRKRERKKEREREFTPATHTVEEKKEEEEDQRWRTGRW